MTKKILPLLLILLVCFTFCKKKKTKEPKEETSFDKQALVKNMADEIILPNYLSFNTALDSLIKSVVSFNTSPSIQTFQDVKEKLQAAYLKYQRTSLFEFGPAEQMMLRMHFNVFPTDSVQIKSNMASGSYDLSATASKDAKGFPALDYLFYDPKKSETQIIQSFSIVPNKDQYVLALLMDMKGKVSDVISGWNSSYRTTFVNSLSSDIGSSIGFLVNQMNFELDNLKNYKIGIPLGKKTLGIILPEDCEAYYGGQSVEYALATLTSIESVYLGKNSAGSDGSGFDDYLDHLGATYAGGSLNTAIKNQFNAARIKLTAISGRLSEQIKTNPSLVNEAYTELVKLIVLLKTDLPSNLGVVINYQDGDGD